MLHKAKLADQNTKDLIFGYLKNKHQKHFPSLIIYYVLAYYNNPEYFEKYSADCCNVSNDATTITSIRDIDRIRNIHQVYAHQQIPSLSTKIVKWKLDAKSSNFYFGIKAEPKLE